MYKDVGSSRYFTRGISFFHTRLVRHCRCGSGVGGGADEQSRVVTDNKMTEKLWLQNGH